MGEKGKPEEVLRFRQDCSGSQARTYGLLGTILASVLTLQHKSFAGRRVGRSCPACTQGAAQLVLGAPKQARLWGAPPTGATQQSRSVNFYVEWDQLGDRLNEVFGEKLRIDVSRHEIRLYSISPVSRPTPRQCCAALAHAALPRGREAWPVKPRDTTHNPLVATGDAWGCPRQPLLHCRRTTCRVLSRSGARLLAALLRRQPPVQLLGTCEALRRGDMARAGFMYVRVEGLRRNDTRDGGPRASCGKGLGMRGVHCLGFFLTLRFAEVSCAFLGYIDTCSTLCSASNITDCARPRRIFGRTPGRYTFPDIGRAGRGGPLETRTGWSLHVVSVVTLRGPPGWLERAWWRALGGVCKRGAPAAPPESVGRCLTRPCPMSHPLATSYNA